MMVNGRNPAPVDGWFIQLCKGFLTSQVERISSIHSMFTDGTSTASFCKYRAKSDTTCRRSSAFSGSAKSQGFWKKNLKLQEKFGWNWFGSASRCCKILKPGNQSQIYRSFAVVPAFCCFVSCKGTTNTTAASGEFRISHSSRQRLCQQMCMGGRP